MDSNNSTAPVKLLHVLNELKPSGAETMLAAAGTFFNRAGIRSHILSTGKNSGEFTVELEASGYTLHHIPFKRYTLFTSPLFLLSFYALLRRERYGVVHVHPERGNFLYAVLAKAAGVRIVVRTVHHIFPQPWTPAGVFFRVVRTIQRLVMQKVLDVILVSNSRSGLENERITYFCRNRLIPNWYDSNRFTPCSVNERREARASLGFAEDLFVVVSLGGNWEYKNFPMIVQALAELPRSMSIRYVQVGPQGDGRPLERLARELGVSDRLQCVGTVPSAVVYLHAADVFAMPSSLEGFGCAAAEAMGCGLPVILAHTPALKDFREHCRGIIYIDPSPTSLAGAIRQVAAMSPESRLALGLELSRRVSEQYGIEVGAARYLALYLQRP
jgi:glycosyltransferase involved in cell wall biosynthesis